MTGIVVWSDNGFADLTSDAVTMEFRYCGYDEIVTPSGEYDFRRLDRILDEIAGRNHQAILRFHFCYPGRQTTVPKCILDSPDYQETVGVSEGKPTHFCDWSSPALQGFVLDFYTRFAKRYDRDPRIAFLQTGFGLWAEYHIYDGPLTLGGTFPSKTYQGRFLRHLDKVFQGLPWSISVDAADDWNSPITQSKTLRSLGFGLFDDSLLCEQHAQENAANWEALSPNRWRQQPAGGELSYYTDRDQREGLTERGPNGISFEQTAKRFHLTYTIGNDQPRYQPTDRIIAAGMVTGYRFRVTGAFVRNEDLHLEVTNEGVAPIYRDAFFAVGEKRSTTSLRGLGPGRTRRCEIEGVESTGLQPIAIHCDSILPTQTIEYSADLWVGPNTELRGE